MVAFLISLEESMAEVPIGTIWSSSPCRTKVGTSIFCKSSVRSVSEQEAGRVGGSKQLLRVGALPPSTRSVVSCTSSTPSDDTAEAITAASGLHMGTVEHVFDQHRTLLS